MSVPYEQLTWLEIPRTGDEMSAPVTVIQDLGDGQKIKREGYVLRLLGDLDPNGRMVQLLIIIKDPLDLEGNGSTKIPLLLGTYVEVQFDGPSVQGAIELPRKAIHEGNKVWIKSPENKLVIHQVELITGDKNSVTIRSDEINDGDEVITSTLPVAIPGMELRNFSEMFDNGNAIK